MLVDSQPFSVQINFSFDDTVSSKSKWKKTGGKQLTVNQDKRPVLQSRIFK